MRSRHHDEPHPPSTREDGAGSRRRVALLVVLATFIVIGAVTGVFAILDEPDGSPSGASVGGPTPAAAPSARPGSERIAELDQRRDDSFPTKETTGPRVPIDSLRPSEAITTEEDGQTIEGLDVASRIKIIHDDVTVRDVRLRFDGRIGTYGIHIAPKNDGTCPENVLIDHIEVIGTDGLSDTSIAVYSPCPYTLTSSRIFDVPNAVRITNGTSIENNFLLADRAHPQTDAHRSAVGLNGGSDHRVVGNTIDCAGTGCSGALVLYGDFARVENVLVQANLLNTTGSYCTYAGSLESKKYPVAAEVRYIDNHFGRKYFDTCGRFGPVAGASDTDGNLWEGNVWNDTGELI